MNRSKLSLTLALVLLAGCAAVGVVETSDPAQKLQQAGQLFGRQDRPLPAERLIREAASIYEVANDNLGLAEAYRIYGFFFRSSSVEHWEKVYRSSGFLDKSATFDGRLDKSIEYFDQSGRLLAQAEKYDQLANVEFNRGVSFTMMRNTNSACAAYDASLAAQWRASEADPALRPSLPPGFSTFQELIADAKRRVPREP